MGGFSLGSLGLDGGFFTGSYFAAAPSRTFTFYVDSAAGLDSNPGTIALPWQTVAKVNGTTLAPGQSVGFKRGGIWRETLIGPIPVGSDEL